MSDYTPVVAKLGQCAFYLIHGRATTMVTQELHEFALQIGIPIPIPIPDSVPTPIPDLVNRVLGKFHQRCERPTSTIDAPAQLRYILADWYNEELYRLERDQGLEKLAKVFSSEQLPGFKSLSDQLLECSKMPLDHCKEDHKDLYKQMKSVRPASLLAPVHQPPNVATCVDIEESTPEDETKQFIERLDSFSSAAVAGADADKDSGKKEPAVLEKNMPVQALISRCRSLSRKQALCLGFSALLIIGSLGAIIFSVQNALRNKSCETQVCSFHWGEAGEETSDQLTRDPGLPCDCPQLMERIPRLPKKLRGQVIGLTPWGVLVAGGTDDGDHDRTSVFLWDFGAEKFKEVSNLNRPRTFACISMTKHKITVRGGIQFDPGKPTCHLSNETLNLRNIDNGWVLNEHETPDRSLCLKEDSSDAFICKRRISLEIQCDSFSF